MPYYNGYRRYGHRRYRRRPYYGRGRSGYSRLSARISGVARRIPRPEVKTETLQVSTSPGAGGTITHLSVIPEGTKRDERTGSQVQLKSIQIRGVANQNDAATTPQRMRLILFVHRSPSGTLPVLGDVLLPATIDGLREPDEARNLFVLRDMTFYISPDRVTGRVEKFLEMFHSLNMRCVWSDIDGLGLINSAMSNHLFLLTMSDEGGIEVPSFNFTYKLNWTDA